jgi:pimeloyl-ACP methyl ester carboxylesterase
VSTNAAPRVPRRVLEAAQRAGERMVARGERTGWKRWPVYRMPPSDLAWLFARLAFGRRPAPVHVELTRAMVSAMPVEASAPSSVGLLHHDARESLADTKTPSIVVVGTRDLLTPIWEARLIADRLPVCELHVIRSMGHMPMYERRAELAEILTRFADGLATTPGG